MFHNRRGKFGGWFIAFGIGFLVACCMPAKALVVVMSVALIIIGICLCKR